MQQDVKVLSEANDVHPVRNEQEVFVFVAMQEATQRASSDGILRKAKDVFEDVPRTIGNHFSRSAALGRLSDIERLRFAHQTTSAEPETDVASRF